MPTVIEPDPIPGPFKLHVTLETADGQAESEHKTIDWLPFREHSFSYEAAKSAKVCTRKIALATARRLHPELDDRATMRTWRTTASGQPTNWPTPDELAARRKIESGRGYKAWESLVSAWSIGRFRLIQPFKWLDGKIEAMIRGLRP